MNWYNKADIASFNREYREITEREQFPSEKEVFKQLDIAINRFDGHKISTDFSSNITQTTAHYKHLSTMTADELLSTLGWSMIATGVITFFVTLFISAPYGRYQAQKGWGWLIPPQIAWMLMESPNLFMPFVISYIYFGSWDGGYRRLTLPNGFLFAMYQFHYIHRSIVYPWLRINPSHHKAMPISVMFMAFFYCLWNGTLQSLSLLVVSKYPATHLLQWNFGFGFVLYVIGFMINVRSDSILLSLKEQSKDQSHSNSDLSPSKKTTSKTKEKIGNSVQTARGTSNTISDISNSYAIPYGGMFEYVSGANYYGEILEWCGYALACWSLAGWVCCHHNTLYHTTHSLISCISPYHLFTLSVDTFSTLFAQNPSSLFVTTHPHNPL